MGRITLNLLFDRLQQEYNQTGSITNVSYPACLLKSLAQLKEVHGVTNIKNQIASQTWYIIKTRDTNIPLLNTCIYGGPGTGKTTIAIILSKIWASIGVLKNKITWRDKLFVGNGLKTSGQRSNYLVNLMITYGTIFFYAVTRFWKLFYNFLVNNYRLLFGVAIVLFLIYRVIYRQADESAFMRAWESGKIDDISPDNVLITLGREDLVAGYLGQTALKTSKVLRENLGKVIFIDEAYSLYQGLYDRYGTEALTVINQFMTEQQGKVLFIFAGYQDKIESQLFKEQPGLPRRFAYHFKMDQYTPGDLYQIFQRQLKESGLEMEETGEFEAEKLFTKHFKDFPYFGGDTKNLITQLKFLMQEKSLLDLDSEESRVTRADLLEAHHMFLEAGSKK